MLIINRLIYFLGWPFGKTTFGCWIF